MQIIMRTTNLHEVALAFRNYARIIHQRCHPSDPYFLHISAACSHVEQWFDLFSVTALPSVEVGLKVSVKKVKSVDSAPTVQARELQEAGSKPPLGPLGKLKRG
jgi:hypothetical protein